MYIKLLILRDPIYMHDLRVSANRPSADTYSPTNAVPSAYIGLTSLFGMGRGVTLYI